MKKVEIRRLTLAGLYPSDEIIALLFQSGEGNSAMPLFQKKYALELPSVRAYLLNKGSGTFGVEDILQDAWEQFLIRLSYGKFKYQGEGSLFRWFFGIARNTFLKDCHNRSRYAMNFTNFDPQAFQLADLPDTLPEDAAIAEELNETLADSLQKQSERNRRLVIGYYVDGRSYEELAEMLDYASPRTAKQRCYMVRMAIRRDMGRRLSA